MPPATVCHQPPDSTDPRYGATTGHTSGLRHISSQPAPAGGRTTTAGSSKLFLSEEKNVVELRVWRRCSQFSICPGLAGGRISACSTVNAGDCCQSSQECSQGFVSQWHPSLASEWSVGVKTWEVRSVINSVILWEIWTEGGLDGFCNVSVVSGLIWL